ncbi:MAG: hypothetical protein CXZ00_03470 [Acidobacteria bacterium]|nr:MAG: hypothetical protein CXZ00_03470 [Acidobacteriota bacterium]
MRFSVRSFRWLLLVLLILSISTQVAAQKKASQSLAELRKQAEQGDARAQFNLGDRYYLGDGLPRDEAEAVRWYRKAAEQGHAQAQYNLGWMYDNGDGVPKDDAEAYFWLNLAAVNTNAREEREAVGNRLTPAKRLEIQERCRKWAEAHPPAQK